ncbi:hypothetical protein V1507DRAFT_456137 [Lipomyces tetrasporus]
MTHLFFPCVVLLFFHVLRDRLLVWALRYTLMFIFIRFSGPWGAIVARCFVGFRAWRIYIYFLSRFSSPVHSCKIACKIRWLINKKNSNIKKKKLFSKHFNQKKMIS